MSATACDSHIRQKTAILGHAEIGPQTGKAAPKSGRWFVTPSCAPLYLLCRTFIIPAAYLRIHHGNCLLNGVAYSQIGRIKQVRIFGGF